uniref:MFS transporter n=1 Tax=Pararhizobium sp. IMCC3301 TaxID=3067904 RepID=UPI0027411D5A|nr:MFS transporter [Pararhizobium sp. IMCC3301]
MFKTIASISSVLLAVAMLVFGHGLQSALVPLRAEIEGFGTLAIGASISAYFAGFVIGCLVGPFLILRAGHIRAYAAMVSLASAVALLHPLLIDETAWAVFRFATGFCIATFYIVIESWLNERATNEIRGLIMSTYVVVTLVGIMAGQFAAALGSVEGFTLFIVASIVVSVAVIPIALTTSAQPAPITLVRFRPRQLYNTSPAAFVSALLIGVSAASTWMLAPVFATGRGFDTSFAAIFAAIMIGGGAVAQWPIGRTSDKFDRRLVIVALGIGSAVFCTLLGLVQGDSRWLFLALVFMVGVFTHSTYAIAVAHAFDHSEPDTYVETSSGMLLAFGIGSTIGPLIASFLMATTEPGALFLFVAVVQVGMVIYLIWRINASKAPAIPGREDFDLASTAPVMAMTNDQAVDLNTDLLIPKSIIEANSLLEANNAVQLHDFGYSSEGLTADHSVEFQPEAGISVPELPKSESG